MKKEKSLNELMYEISSLLVTMAANSDTSPKEKRDALLSAIIILSATWKIYADSNVGDLLLGFPFKDVEQQSVVVDIPQVLLSEIKSMLNIQK